jgi:hypothetical protein
MDIINEIDSSKNITYDQSFDFALQCSKLLLGSDTGRSLAYRAIIHVLEKWETIPQETHSIWTDIIDAAGFYPYIEKNKHSMILNSLSDEIRQKYYLSDYISNIYMHSEQKKLLDYLLSGKNVVASAPTSFGKSLLIEELVASRKYKNIIVIQPTLALLDETRIKLKKYGDIYKIIIRTSQAASLKRNNLFLLTAECVMEYTEFPRIDLLIIDEFYKMSLRRMDERADTLNNAFLKIYNNFQPHFYLMGPNIDRITDGFADKYNALFFKTAYSLVDCNIKQMSVCEISEKEKIKMLFSLLDEKQGEQTLIYCSSPMRARRLARTYMLHLKETMKMLNISLPLIDWLNKNIPKWSLAEELACGVAVHDGSLPKHIGASIIHYFNRKMLFYIFCTSTIIEGVNTSAKNVIIFDNKKGTNEIDYFDYSNIKGRSGRFMEHYIGNIYSFINIPSQKTIEIDIPFYEQDKDVLTNEILINIQEKDVQTQVKQKYDYLYETIEGNLMKIIKLNGTDVFGQLTILKTLVQNINTQQSSIVWTNIPTWEQMLFILRLGEKNIYIIDRHGINSVEQLAVYLDKYRKGKNIMQIVQDIYDYTTSKIKNLTDKIVADHYEKAIEKAFHIYRYWFQFSVPKVFRVVDNLQRYVCENNGIKAGSYSYFVQQLENDFVPNNMSILVEYGIPSDTVRKLAQNIPSSLSEDNVIQYIKENKDRLVNHLMIYEKDRIEQCL